MKASEIKTVNVDRIKLAAYLKEHKVRTANLSIKIGRGVSYICNAITSPSRFTDEDKITVLVEDDYLNICKELGVDSKDFLWGNTVEEKKPDHAPYTVNTQAINYRPYFEELIKLEKERNHQMEEIWEKLNDINTSIARLRVGLENTTVDKKSVECQKAKDIIMSMCGTKGFVDEDKAFIEADKCAVSRGAMNTALAALNGKKQMSGFGDNKKRIWVLPKEEVKETKEA